MKYLRKFRESIVRINEEYTDMSFDMPSQTEMDMFQQTEWSEILPESFKSNYEATKRLRQFVGGKMFVHVAYVKFNTPDGILFIHRREYWLRDEEVKVCGVSITKDYKGENEQRLGTLLVDTDKFLKVDMPNLRSKYETIEVGS